MVFLRFLRATGNESTQVAVGTAVLLTAGILSILFYFIYSILSLYSFYSILSIYLSIQHFSILLYSPLFVSTLSIHHVSIRSVLSVLSIPSFYSTPSILSIGAIPWLMKGRNTKKGHDYFSSEKPQGRVDRIDRIA